MSLNHEAPCSSLWPLTSSASSLLSHEPVHVVENVGAGYPCYLIRSFLRALPGTIELVFVLGSRVINWYWLSSGLGSLGRNTRINNERSLVLLVAR